MPKNQNSELPVLSIPGPDQDEAVFESYVWSMAKRIWEENDGRKRKVRRPDRSYIKDEMPPASSIFVERILLLIAYAASSEYSPSDAMNKIKVQPSERLMRGYLDVEIPCSAISSDWSSSYNFERIMDAVHYMQSVVFRFDTKESIRFNSLIIESEAYRSGTIRFSVAPLVWEKLMNFQKGFTMTEFWVAKRLSNARSLSMYKLIRNLNFEMDISIERLVQRLNLPPEYCHPSHLERRCLNRVKRDLDALAPWSFSYERVEIQDAAPEGSGKRKRGAPKKQVRYKISSVYHPENDRKLQAAIPCATPTERYFAVDNTVRSIFVANGFSDIEITNVSGLLVACCEKLGLVNFTTRLLYPEFYTKWAGAKNRNAFVVKAIKEWIDEPVRPR